MRTQSSSWAHAWTALRPFHEAGTSALELGYLRTSHEVLTASPPSRAAWNLLMKSISDLGAATSQSSSPGLSWGERYSYCVDAGISKMTPEERIGARQAPPGIRISGGRV